MQVMVRDQRSEPGPCRRSGITLTEILIAIMILGIGLVSLATLFPIGLLRLRDAQRYTRTATLVETAAADLTSRGLLGSQSFQMPDLLNAYNSLTLWYYADTWTFNAAGPLVLDTAYYGDDPLDANNPGANALNTITGGGPGLAIAYDPLWRYYTGVYLDGVNMSTPEARFGFGLPFIRPDTTGGGTVASAHGLQRITNFHPLMPANAFVPNIFVSQEDVVWQDPEVNTYTLNGTSLTNSGVLVNNPSPVVPDLSAPANAGQGANGGTPSIDWRYSWMFTGQLSNAHNPSTFDGNIVIFENRPFNVQVLTSPPYTPAGNYSSQLYQVEGEIVVEGVFGYGGYVFDSSGTGNSGPGYAANANRTVLLRWETSMPDPVVRPGDWIADVTYERSQFVVYNPNNQTGRFMSGSPPVGYANSLNSGEWDDLPAQRCFWYQVQKVTSPVNDTSITGHTLRSMVVYVNQNLQARTVLNADGTPKFLNAALIAPNVINVIPKTIFVR